MFGRHPRRAITLLVMWLAACGGGQPPPPAQPAQRVSIARRMLPPDIAPHVPKHGVYLAGGGAKSPVFRVIVDTDAKTIHTATAPAASPVHDSKATQERTRELTPRNEEHLMKLCSDAWSEAAPSGTGDPVEGYDEYLVIANGEEVFFLHERGPIKRSAAMKAIEALRAAAAL